MGLESVTKISDLNSSWPLSGDDRHEGDDHIRITKVALKSLLTDLNQIKVGPASLSGEAGKALIVNAGEDGFDELATLFDEENEIRLDLGKQVAGTNYIRLDFYCSNSVVADMELIRYPGENGVLFLLQGGTGGIKFRVAGVDRLIIPDGGGVTEIWDDTPTNGETKKGVTSDWAYKHVNNVDAHRSMTYAAPSGTINGSNKTFTLAGTPRSAASLHVFRQGVLLKLTTHYTRSGSTLTFVSAPLTGDWLWAFYED